MKAVVLSICACLAWPALAADGLAECATIEGAVERLDCYDRLARQQARQQTSQPAGEDAAHDAAQQSSVLKPQPATVPAETESATTQKPVQTNEQAADERATKDTPGSAVADFGRPEERAATEEAEVIEAHIESVRKGLLGKQIMTLSNGQIWMENEPGRRRIEPDQRITIRKHRWHYEMELASQPNVTVRRVD